jgi:formate hydrogenlyase subunit 6/NADH:ubiquinone oxidoreductase subunit I
MHPATAALAEVGRTLATLRVSPAGRPRLVQFPLPPERMARDLGEPVLEGRVSRRALFAGPSRAIQAPGGGAAQAAVPPAASQAQRRLAALSRLAAQPALPAALFPTLLAGAACAGHGVCAAACPTGAIREYRTEGALGTGFDAAACIACGVCTRLCPEQALTLHPAGDAADTYPGPQPLTRFALSTCLDCGADCQGDEPACPACLRDHSFARDAFRTLFGAATA